MDSVDRTIDYVMFGYRAILFVQFFHSIRTIIITVRIVSYSFQCVVIIYLHVFEFIGIFRCTFTYSVQRIASCTVAVFVQDEFMTRRFLFYVTIEKLIYLVFRYTVNQSCLRIDPFHERIDDCRCRCRCRCRRRHSFINSRQTHTDMYVWYV